MQVTLLAIHSFRTVWSVDVVSVLSKITNILNADPGPNGTAIPVGTQKAIGQFKFIAAEHANSRYGTNKVVLSDILFNVQAQNVQLGASNFRLYNKADPTVKSNCSLAPGSASAALVVKCENIPTTSSVNTVFDPGEEQTFVLEAHVINPKVNPVLPSFLQVSLQNFTNNKSTSLGVSSSHIRWLDQDNVATPFLWVEHPNDVVQGTSYTD